VDTARVPAALRIAGQLQGKIESQVYRPGEWLPTERELAVEFSSDRATIRSAIAHLAELGLIEREPGRRPRVVMHDDLAVVPKDPRPASTGLRTIAAIIPQPRNYPALGLIQRGILRVLRRRQADYRLVVFDNQGDVWSQSVEMEQQALAAVENDGSAGAILWPIGGEETQGSIARLQALGVPLVLLDRYPEGFSCDFVGIDNRAAGHDATNYLLDLGHRRIAHLTSSSAVMTGRERLEGYREALASHGISEEVIYRVPDHDDLYPDVSPVIQHILTLPDPPTALFAMKDILAHAFIRAATAAGLRVPEDISVIGFDDHDRHSLQPPFLTTVHQPFEQMGERAADLLLRRLAGPSTAPWPLQHVLVPTPLVIRSSCRALPTSMNEGVRIGMSNGDLIAQGPLD
jgi:DNA-binding LacI/PurR family transcriptional regulator